LVVKNLQLFFNAINSDCCKQLGEVTGESIRAANAGDKVGGYSITFKDSMEISPAVAHSVKSEPNSQYDYGDDRTAK
jgi:hypothetical protein